MDLQKAANGLANALIELGVATGVASASGGCELTVSKDQSTKVYFTHDQLGGLLVEVALSGEAPRRVDYIPTAGAAAQLAQMIADRIAGSGGG